MHHCSTDGLCAAGRIARVRRLPPPSIDWLLVFLPISIVAGFLGQTVLVFATSALAIIPLAGLIGRSTEQLAVRLGPRLGGLLNATLGNITELIVAVLLINAGNFAIVKASPFGSVACVTRSSSSALEPRASTRLRCCLPWRACWFQPS